MWFSSVAYWVSRNNPQLVLCIFVNTGRGGWGQLALTQVSISCCCLVSWLIITRPISSYSVMNLRCRPPSLTCQRKFKANLCDLLLALKVINHRRDKLFFCSAWLKEVRKLHSADANSCPQRAVHNKNRCTKVELMCEFCTDMGHQTPEVQG